MTQPRIIQGGMGAGVSGWQLARAVSKAGELGVVSGVGLDTILARKLQLGDPDGELRRALSQLPLPGAAEAILDRWFVPDGLAAGSPFRAVRMHGSGPDRLRDELTIAGSFVEVFLAKEGHEGLVGINLLRKIQDSLLLSIFGAMLAGVDHVLIGAGIPVEVPGALDRLTALDPASLTLHLQGPSTREHRVHLDPADFLAAGAPPLKRPSFFGIVASAVVATTLVRRATGRVDGLVLENALAGGHVAPPRGRMKLDASGQPLYGKRDEVEPQRLRDLGLPFWLAGARARASDLRHALEVGAAGVQVGTAFAFCRESGIEPELKQRILEDIAAGTATVRNDPSASPTGFPFRILDVEGSLSRPDVLGERARVCDLGYLRQVREKADGTLEYRCPGERVESWLAKGGELAETAGRVCLCNGLLATIGVGQRRGERAEPPLVTAGEDLSIVAELSGPCGDGYGAAEVLASLRGR
jgi:nitronate monooxygenase